MGENMRWITFLLLLAASNTSYAEVAGSRWFIGSSAFMLANLDHTDEPPHFYQLNLGYQLSQKDVLSLELITWTYYAPLGYGVLTTDTPKYPGSVKGVGPGLAYQRFLWRGLYAALHASWMKQEYRDVNKKKLAEGEQLFMTVRLGYHIEFGGHFFIEPSIALTSWPIQRGLPATFQEKENAAPKLAGEPGLHLGLIF